MPAPTIPAQVQSLVDQLGQPRPMRRGSVSERYVKCNKEGCPCGDQEDARHGPYYSVSRVVKGRTSSRWLDAEQAELVRQQIEAGQQFRKQVESYWQACEHWADAQLLEAASTPEAAKKRGSRRHSRARSGPKSPRS